MNQVPFNRSYPASNQMKYVQECLISGHLSGDGPFSKDVSKTLSSIHGGSSILLTTSCTAALEMCALLIELQPGDEVIVPSFTFVSSANAFVLSGATVVFVDIDPVSFNLDPEQVKMAITSKTKAVVAVNYGGYSAVSLELARIIEEHNLILIEDNAHGLFGKSNGVPLGVNSSLSTLSFHETKNITCGEGGALVINDARLLERAEIIREKGTNRSNFFRGMVDKYTWVDKGSSYLLSDVNASILKAQLESVNFIQDSRSFAMSMYDSQLENWSQKNNVVLPKHLLNTDSSFHLFPLLVPDLDFRNQLIQHCKNSGVGLAFHYVPLHSSPAAMKYSRNLSDCVVSSNVSERLVRLPVFSDIKSSEVEKVVSVVKAFSRH